MYRIPEDFDESKLLNINVEMICINSTQIYLHFNFNTTVVIESSYSINNSVPFDIHENKSESYFVNLINQDITKIEIDSNRLDITFHFSDNTSLKLINQVEYECFKINFDNKFYIF
jgi:hypothetical protein